VGSLALARQGSTQLRTVRGTVVSSSGAPIARAVVYLKNMRTLTVRTYFSSRNGDYRFSGLDPNVDYEIHAEYQNRTSVSHTISSFDSNPEIIIQLKIDRKKSSS
jgi:Carboxypeptidase regulatory-like domain